MGSSAGGAVCCSPANIGRTTGTTRHPQSRPAAHARSYPRRPPYGNLAVGLQVEGNAPIEPFTPMDPTRSTARVDGLSGPVYMIASPYDAAASVGDQFYNATLTYAFGGNVQLRVRALGAAAAPLALLELLLLWG